MAREQDTVRIKDKQTSSSDSDDERSPRPRIVSAVTLMEGLDRAWSIGSGGELVKGSVAAVRKVKREMDEDKLDGWTDGPRRVAGWR